MAARPMNKGFADVVPCRLVDDGRPMYLDCTRKQTFAAWDSFGKRLSHRLIGARAVDQDKGVGVRNEYDDQTDLERDRRQEQAHCRGLLRKPMKTLIRLSSLIYALLTVFFVAAALCLMVIGVNVGLQAILSEGVNVGAAQGVIEAIGLMAAAVVAVEIAQTIGEEEVIRQAHVSGPTRVRRFLSRFMVVVIVALAIEGMVATFKALHENLVFLPHVAAFLAGVGVLLAGWGVFIRLNRDAEELEPEAMQQAKQEDRKLE
jgi:hypothetical protein